MLSEKQCEAVELLAAHYTRAETAKRVGVSEVTIYRWLSNPEFERAIKNYREVSVQQAMAAVMRDQLKDLEHSIAVLLDPSVPSEVKIPVAARLIKRCNSFLGEEADTDGTA